VLAVIRNRANDPKNRWPKTLAGVVLQPFQFSSFNRNDANVTAWPKAPRIGTAIESISADWKAWLECATVFDAPLTADPTNSATHYHDSSIPPPAVAWLGPGKTVADLEALKTCEIGKLAFYRIP
jgi:spore germination cell wall hydrolase CwlJ-like protein